MNGNVIDLALRRREQSPLLCGEAACLACEHHWIAVLPVDWQQFEWLYCPACLLFRGWMEYPVPVLTQAGA